MLNTQVYNYSMRIGCQDWAIVSFLIVSKEREENVFLPFQCCSVFCQPKIILFIVFVETTIPVQIR